MENNPIIFIDSSEKRAFYAILENFKTSFIEELQSIGKSIRNGNIDPLKLGLCANNIIEALHYLNTVGSKKTSQLPSALSFSDLFRCSTPSLLIAIDYYIVKPERFLRFVLYGENQMSFIDTESIYDAVRLSNAESGISQSSAAQAVINFLNFAGLELTLDSSI